MAHIRTSSSPTSPAGFDTTIQYTPIYVSYMYILGLTPRSLIQASILQFNTHLYVCVNTYIHAL